MKCNVEVTFHVTVTVIDPSVGLLSRLKSKTIWSCLDELVGEFSLLGVLQRFNIRNYADFSARTRNN